MTPRFPPGYRRRLATPSRKRRPRGRLFVFCCHWKGEDPGNAVVRFSIAFIHYVLLTFVRLLFTRPGNDSAHLVRDVCPLILSFLVTSVVETESPITETDPSRRIFLHRFTNYG